MTFNFTTKSIDFSKTDQAIFMKIAHPTKFTTGQLAEQLAAVYSTNLEQDLIDILTDLEAIQTV